MACSVNLSFSALISPYKTLIQNIHLTRSSRSLLKPTTCGTVVKVLRHECLASGILSVNATCHCLQMAARAHLSARISNHCNKSEMGDEQDRLLPIANVGRIMKQILPPAAKISKEAKQRMQECASEFISFVTCEASDRCHKENRKTVNGDDVYWALCSLGLDNHAEATGKYLHKYREFERERALQNKASTVTQGNSEEFQPSTDPSSLEITVMDRK